MRTILFLFCLLPVLAKAQTTGTEIVKDPRIDLLIKKQSELNKKVYLDNNRTTQGFRILVVNTSDRKVAMDTKTSLMRDFPSHKTYLIYQSPYFKIQIGNFLTREDAESLRKKISKKYTSGVIVIPSMLVVISAVLGIWGGRFAGGAANILAPETFDRGLFQSFMPFNVTFALIKAYTFSFIISSISAYYGYNVEGGALEIGRASTQAVVTSCIMILLADYLLAALLL